MIDVISNTVLAAMAPHLKLIAIIPPEPAFSVVRQEQEHIQRTWGPAHALRTPPHLTIIPPVALTAGEVGLLLGLAGAIAGEFTPFDMELNGYGAFKPRVLFIHPQPAPALNELHDIWRIALMTRMPHVLAKYPDRPFHPHVTLAHKDVKGMQFSKMWSYYEKKEFHAFFRVDHFHILKHVGDGWVMERKYPLMG